MIMHKKNDYQGVESWMGSEYMDIPHSSIENQDLKVSPEDFIVILKYMVTLWNKSQNFHVEKLFCVKHMTIC